MFEIANTVTDINRAFIYITVVAAIFIIGITTTMLFFVVRFDKRRNPDASNIEGNIWLEITWSVIPTLLALGMFYFGWLGYKTVRTTPDGAMKITAKARTYSWIFEYENGKQATEMFVPLGRPIYANLVSEDVIHSFYIPAYRIKGDCVPTVDNYINFTPLRVGVFDIHCAEFCGIGHSAMNSRLHVMKPKDFAEWYKSRDAQRPLNMTKMIAASPAQLERGETVYKLNCAACHGRKGDGSGRDSARDFTTTDGWTSGSTVAEMFETVAEGMGDEMPSFSHLPADDRFAAIHYVRAFAQGHPDDTPEQVADLDDAYSLSTGDEAPPKIPIDEAMKRIAAESASDPTKKTAPAATALYRD